MKSMIAALVTIIVLPCIEILKIDYCIEILCKSTRNIKIKNLNFEIGSTI